MNRRASSGLSPPNVDWSVRRHGPDRWPAVPEVGRYAAADIPLQRDGEVDAHATVDRARLQVRRVAIRNAEVHGAVRGPQIEPVPAPPIAIQIDVQRTIRGFAMHVARHTAERNTAVYGAEVKATIDVLTLIPPFCVTRCKSVCRGAHTS